MDELNTTAPRQVIEVYWPGMDPRHMWEYDFMREIFPYPYFSHLEEPTQQKQDQSNPELPRIGAVVCTGGQHLNDVKELSDALKRVFNTDRPKLVLIHLSDEFLGQSYGHTQVMLPRITVHRRVLIVSYPSGIAAVSRSL